MLVAQTDLAVSQNEEANFKSDMSTGHNDMPIWVRDMPASIGRAVPARFLRDAADRYSGAIEDDATVTREAVDAVQCQLALINLAGTG